MPVGNERFNRMPCSEPIKLLVSALSATVLFVWVQKEALTGAAQYVRQYAMKQTKAKLVRRIQDNTKHEIRKRKGVSLDLVRHRRHSLRGAQSTLAQARMPRPWPRALHRLSP